MTAHDRVLVSSDAAGGLRLTPLGRLDADLARALLGMVTSAASSKVTSLVLDLGRVVSFDEHGVHATRCCRRLAERTNTRLQVRAVGPVASSLLTAAVGPAALPAHV